MSNHNDKFTNEKDTRFTLRIDSEILNQIKVVAKENKRSTAKQIEFILEQYFQNKREE